jgi:hypothetical protein
LDRTKSLRIPAGDMVSGAAVSSLDSSPSDERSSGTRSGGRYEMVVSEWVLVGRDD